MTTSQPRPQRAARRADRHHGPGAVRAPRPAGGGIDRRVLAAVGALALLAVLAVLLGAPVGLRAPLTLLTLAALAALGVRRLRRGGVDRAVVVAAALLVVPVLAGSRVTHAWGGALGIPRDWTASVGLDRRTGLAWAGGYVGDGLSTTNLAGRTLRDRNVLDAEKMADDDEEVDNLRTHQFRLLLDEGWDHGVEAAVDCALLGRYYERIADHAVLMGSRVIYIVTGMQPEGENWTIA